MATRRYVEAVQAYVATRDAFHRAAADQMVNSVEAERRIDDQIRSLRDQRMRSSPAASAPRVNLSNKLPRSTTRSASSKPCGAAMTGGTPQTPAYISVALGSAYFRTSAFADAEREWRAALQADPSLARRTTTSPSS